MTWFRPGRFLTVAASVGLLVGCAVGTSSGPSTTPSAAVGASAGARSSAAADALAMAVKGAHLVDGAGRVIRLLGVNRSGTEYACVQGWGIFDGPHDDASVSAIAAWHANAVRVALNEDCWLGINGVRPDLAGANYQRAIVDYVNLLHAHGLYAVLNLHWNAPGSARATGQLPMPDADHAPAFWRSVAATFRDDPAVLFDLYNEPYDVGWSCWRDGCWVAGWARAGMQTLVDAVRGTGATQPIMLGGIDWANNLDQWLQFAPTDPDHALVASFHLYDANACNDAGCWSRVLGPLSRRVPVVTGEVGESDCGHAFLDRFMAFADAHGISYLAWVWETWGCGGTGIALIRAYDGTPTNYGIGLRDHLQLFSRP